MFLQILASFIVCTVRLAGTRFRYPSSFVLVAGDVDAELTRIHASLFQHQSTDSEAGAAARTTSVVDNALSKLAGAVRLDCGFRDERAAQRTISKTWQDAVVSSGLFMHGYDLRNFCFCSQRSHRPLYFCDVHTSTSVLNLDDQFLTFLSVSFLRVPLFENVVKY